MSNEKIDKVLKGLEGLLSDSNKNIKVFKSANNKSILDVTASLDYHKLNNKNEEVYKGKVIFSITEIGKNKYLKAFVDKSKAKILTNSIVNHTFGEKVFKGGFTDFGGTFNSDPEKVRSRIFKINLTERGQFVFNIDEGKGKIGDTGSIQMVGKPEISVSRYVPYEEALQMAHEVHDYIRDQEMLALIKGKPLFTISNFEANLTQNSINNDKENNKGRTTVDEYIIQVDPWKGKRIKDLKNEELKYILEKTRDIDNDIVKELNQEAMKEAKRRMEERK